MATSTLSTASERCFSSGLLRICLSRMGVGEEPGVVGPRGGSGAGAQRRLLHLAAVGFFGGQLVLGMGVQRVTGFSPAVLVVWHADTLTLRPGRPVSPWSRDLQGLSRPGRGSGLGRAVCVRG